MKNYDTVHCERCHFLYIIFFHCVQAKAGKSAAENCAAVDIDVVAATVNGGGAVNCDCGRMPRNHKSVVVLKKSAGIADSVKGKECLVK